MNYTFNEGDNITVTAEFIDYLENLKKEKQQLKSVLDEIREYINNTEYDYVGSKCFLKDSVIGENILQILDKVKE